jgi:hypothetical protein
MTTPSSDRKDPTIMRHHRPLTLTSAVALATITLFAAGCGGGSPGVANVSSPATTATATAQHGVVAFAECMRTHGVPRFPDPAQVNQQRHKPSLQQLGVSGPQFEAAQRNCIHLLPNGGSDHQDTVQQRRTQLADELSFARCMRSHGVSRFPDPTVQGGLTVEMVRAQGIDVHSPAILRVVQACLPASHGALTPAMVRQALKNNGR